MISHDFVNPSSYYLLPESGLLRVNRVTNANQVRRFQNGYHPDWLYNLQVLSKVGSYIRVGIGNCFVLCVVRWVDGIPKIRENYFWKDRAGFWFWFWEWTPSIGRKVGIPRGILPHVQTGLTNWKSR